MDRMWGNSRFSIPDSPFSVGATCDLRLRVAADPSQPNLRQVHLIHGELHDALRLQGEVIRASDATTIALPPAPHRALERV
jgi:hypothetical protein